MHRLHVVLIVALGPVLAAAAELPPALRNIIPTPQQIEPAEGAFVIAADGAAVASLVTPQDPPAKVALAAAHLARRIEEMSGVTLLVVTEGEYTGGPALWFGAAARSHLTPEWNDDLAAA